MPPPSPPIPGLPHPDVEIVKGMFRALEPGQQVTYLDVAKALNIPEEEMHIVWRRATTARKQLARTEGISIDVVRGVGYVRETESQIQARIDGRESPGICRKAGRILRSLACIDISKLNETERQKYCVQTMVANVTRKANGSRAKQVLLAAAKVSQNQLPMSQALEVLKNGKDEKE